MQPCFVLSCIILSIQQFMFIKNPVSSKCKLWFIWNEHQGLYCNSSWPYSQYFLQVFPSILKHCSFIFINHSVQIRPQQSGTCICYLQIGQWSFKMVNSRPIEYVGPHFRRWMFNLVWGNNQLHNVNIKFVFGKSISRNVQLKSSMCCIIIFFPILSC